MKIALGTVQFGLNYGINNQTGIPSKDELNLIFNLAKTEGIDTLDTAHSYGDAELKICEYLNDFFKVVSKFTVFDINKLSLFLQYANCYFIYGYMAHNSDLLINNPSWWDQLLLAKENGKIRKIGYSVYEVSQLDKLLKMDMFPDIIQVPYNVLDRRFESYMTDLSKIGVEIHVRSVYLQGLFYMDPKNVPVGLVKIKPYLVKINDLAKDTEIPISHLCLGFVKEKKNIDKIVIGVDTHKQLRDNLISYKMAALSDDVIDQLSSINVQDSKLLNPSNWK